MLDKKILSHGYKYTSIFCIAVFVAAAATLAGSDVGAGNNDKIAQDLLNNFNPKKGTHSSESVDGAASLGLKASRENAQKLNDIIRSDASLEQRKSAVRLLGQQYTNSSDYSVKALARACYELTAAPKAGIAIGSMRITKIRKCNPASTSGSLS